MAGSGTAHLRDGVLLRAEHLVVEFPVGRTGLRVHAVSDVSLDVHEGETLGLVGESGCGKSTTGRALMQLPRPTSGTVTFRDTELTTLPGSDLRRMRPEMQMIFQDPISSLNPRRKVGDIVAEPLRIWASEKNPPGLRVRVARALLHADAAVRIGAVVAMLALLLINAGIPGLTGIEVNLLGPIDEWLRAGASSLLVGAIVFGTASLAIAPTIRDRLPKARRALFIEAVAALVYALLVPGELGGSAFVVSFAGAVLTMAALVAAALSADDFASAARQRAEHDQAVRRVLEDVGIDPDDALGRRPHQFSGGQCQRICVARALVLDPKVIICDEPVSALDVSVQAQILNLLEDMKARYGLTLVFIAHDLAVVKNISDRVAVMYLGKLCEIGGPDTLYHEPAHPYTAALLASIPEPDPTRHTDEHAVLYGEIPSPVAPPSGCRFRTRCPRAEEACARVEPQIRPVAEGHYVACHFPLVGPVDETVSTNGRAAGEVAVS